MKPGTIIKPKDMIVVESELDECRRENRELLARMRKLEAVVDAAIKFHTNFTKYFSGHECSLKWSELGHHELKQALEALAKLEVIK